jgi:transcriptional regulator of acetoin/glycerol metabolism
VAERRLLGSHSDPAAVELARERFLGSDSGGGDPSVRQVILASWRRSRESSVDVDRIQLPYVSDRDHRTPLLQCATPILDALNEHLQFEPVSIVLTDQSGLVLDRRVTSRELAARLDAVSLSPGFSYAEEFAGTNGIGTAISSGRAAFVDGREHYTNVLGQFACAGAPIHHPTRRAVIGILDLTSWAHTSGAMLMALAAATAREIEEALLTHTGTREAALFREYLNECRKSSGALLAIDHDIVMMNEQLRLLLDGTEQQSLIDYAGESLRRDDRGLARTVELPSGRTAYLRGVPVASAAGPGGCVFRIRLGNAKMLQTPKRSSLAGSRTAAQAPGLVGSGPAWLRCVEQVNSCYEAGERMALVGEAGCGKQAVLRAAHVLHNPVGTFRVLHPPDPAAVDAWLAEFAEALESPGAMVVLAHADRLSEAMAAALVDQLVELDVDDDDPARRAHVALTTTVPIDQGNALATGFPRTVEVPPLRHHIDDIEELVPHLLSQLAGEHRVEMSSAALAQLRRLDWPSNVNALRALLADVVRLRRAGVIEVADLPLSARTSGHRVLTQIETIERDAIVRALLDNDERPAKAAAALGISRATIYRKFRHYGISLPLAH